MKPAVRVREEMESVPPEQEICYFNRRALGMEPQPIDAEELAVCRRRDINSTARSTGMGCGGGAGCARRGRAS